MGETGTRQWALIEFERALTERKYKSIWQNVSGNPVIEDAEDSKSPSEECVIEQLLLLCSNE